MFWKSKKRGQEERLAADTMRGVAEGYNCAMIDDALSTLGKQLPTGPDATQYCISAVKGIVTAIMERAGAPPLGSDDDSRFAGGMFAFVASDHVSRLMGAPFEIVSSVAVVTLFFDPRTALEGADLVRQVADAHNKLAEQGGGKTLQAIGQGIAGWINEPTDARLSRLAELFVLCRKNVA